MVSLFNLISSLFSIIPSYSAISFFENARPDFSIEGMRSYEFSVAIFIFLVLCIFVFTYIVICFMKGDKKQKLKRGEKIMFAWIFLGIVVAIIMGAMQMVVGNLL